MHEVGDAVEDDGDLNENSNSNQLQNQDAPSYWEEVVRYSILIIYLGSESSK